MQYLDAVSKLTEWPLFISKANHDYKIMVIQACARTSRTTGHAWGSVQWFNFMLKKLKLNGSMKTYKNF